MSFDRDEALYRAMLLFWRHGYESTSLNDLTQALQITPPSLYGAFGDKKRLFLEAVDLYLSGPSSPERIIDASPTAREAARRLLSESAVGFTGDVTPPGCLLASAAISCSDSSLDVQRTVAERRSRIEERLRDKARNDIATGHLPSDTDVEAIVAHTMAVIQGMSTLARDGADRTKLQSIVQVAMRVWPE